MYPGSNAFKAGLQSAISDNPQLTDLLREFFKRSYRNGELPQRATFRDLSPAVVSDLRMLFGPHAVKQRQDRVSLSLHAAGLESPESRDDLLRALSEVLNLPIKNLHEQRERSQLRLLAAHKDLATQLHSDLAEKVCARLTADLEQRRGLLWRAGILKQDSENTLGLVQDILRALELLAGSDRMWSFAELGSRVTSSSKSFRTGSELYRLTADLALPFLEEESQLAELGNSLVRRKRVWEILGVAESLVNITVMAAGPLVYEKHGRQFAQVKQHFELGEPALLSLVHLDKIDRFAPHFDAVLTVENLAPFAELARQPVMPHCLTIYTEGFPNRAVQQLLRLCQRHVQPLRFFHWGDTDLAGVHILRQLAATIGVVPELFRCTPKDIERHCEVLIPLMNKQRVQIERDLATHPEAPGRDLLECVLECNGWLEQEAWEE